jgi:hypothetical protein
MSGLADLANNELGPGTSYTASGVTRGTYFVRMRARNGCGTGAVSNEVATSVGATTPLAILGLGGQFTVQSVDSAFVTTGNIDVTMSAPVFGLISANLGSVRASQRVVAPTPNLQFHVALVTALCPDLRRVIPLSLYDGAGNLLASTDVQFHGTGCAFDP